MTVTPAGDALLSENPDFMTQLRRNLDSEIAVTQARPMTRRAGWKLEPTQFKLKMKQIMIIQVRTEDSRL